MDLIFAGRLLLSFIFGGLAIAIALSIAERFGGKIGALALMLPTNSLVAMFFIGLTLSVGAVQKAIPFAFVSLGAYMVFVCAFILFSPKLGGKKALLAGIGAWAVVALPSLVLRSLDFVGGLAIFGAIFVLAVLLFPARDNETKKSGTDKFSKKGFLYRCGFAGGVVCLAVFLANAIGAELGGLFSMFPASTFSAYWLLLQKHDAEYVSGLARRMLPFNLNFIVYCTAVFVAYQAFGIYLGTIASMGLTVVFGLGLYKINDRGN